MVTGTPGIGKTTISEKLAARLEALHIDIGELVKKERLTSGYDAKRQTLISDPARLAGRVNETMAKTRKTIIIDGHYGTELVPKDQVTKVFVLRCHPEQLKKRMQEKGFQGSKLKENLAAEILDVCLTSAITNVGPNKVCELNTTDKTSDAVVSEIISILKKKRHCALGIVDWLGQLEMEKSLGQYLQEF
ncbi:MAG TPA: adenylate kinase family protein [Candidatus Bathyarchaeia archaeon]|nr:adenylate kinase family protein [Candidatus Bathyarchaeia archaeon]